MKTVLAIGAAIVMPFACWAFEPQFDGAGQLMADTVEPQGLLLLSTGPFEEGFVPSRSLPGNVTRRSWRLSRNYPGVAALAVELESQMRDQGYDVVFKCETNACGGFDFRFGINVFPPPKMFVDLSNYFYLAGVNETSDSLQATWVMVSQTVQAGMIQIDSVAVQRADESNGKAAQDASQNETQVQVSESHTVLPIAAIRNLGSELEQNGHVVLSDLSFETGASKLADQEFKSLTALAEYLKAREDMRIALVGHTDSQGTLEVNTRISQQRAQAVKNRLVELHGVPSKQIEARGAGYLAPVGSNLTDIGRNANRRVEAVLLSFDK